MSQLATRPGGAITVIENRPLVSAVLLTRNSESHLRECLSGLMEQSVADRLEVIVVDQGSDQCEWAVVADLQRKHRNIISLRLPAGSSVCSGLNMAVKIASGKYLTVLDATDRLRRDAYQQLAQALEANPSAMLIYGDTCFTAIPHESFDNHTSYGKVIWPDYTPQQLNQVAEIAPHLVWRRELHDSVGLFAQAPLEQGMREFLLGVVERFRIAHLQEFLGLRLITTGAQPNQEAPRHTEQAMEPAREAVRQPEVIRQPEAAQTAPPAPPRAVVLEEDADEAYAAILPILKGDQQQAAEAIAAHLAAHPKHAIAHNDLGAVCYNLGDKERAILHYREAVWLSPQDPVYRKNLADMLFVEAGQTDEAIGIYLNLLKEFPRDTETLLNLGIICEQVGQPAEADSFYQRVLEIEPANPAARERITALRDGPAPLEVAQEAAREPEDDEPAEERYERVQPLVADGDMEGAERELEAILRSYPEFALAYNDLAVLSHQRGDKEKALERYRKAAQLAPGNSTFQKNLADFYFVEGYDIDEAVAIYLEELRKEPKNIETLMNLGKICTVLERPKEAEIFYGKVTQLEPWNRDARECLETLKQVANA